MTLNRQILLKARFESNRAELDAIIGHITPDLMDWAPAPGMRTIGGQLAEIIAVEMPLVASLTTGTPIPQSEVEEIIGDCGSLDNLRQKLTEVRQQTLDYLDSLSETDLAEEVTCDDVWFGAMWLPNLPRAEVLLNVAEHELYHVGQLTSYLWARGDNPYEW